MEVTCASILPGPWLSKQCTDEKREGELQGEEWVRSDDNDGMNEQFVTLVLYRRLRRDPFAQQA